MEKNAKSIVEMARGAILERINYEMARVMDNILDCLLYTSDAADD